jgi:type II secretory pathway component PulJ
MPMSPSLRHRFYAARGFTLLEISIVLLIAMILLGMSSVMVSSLYAEHRVRSAVSAIEALGIEAMARASTYRRQQAITFLEDRCELMDESGELVRSVEVPSRAKLWLKRYLARDYAEANGQVLRIIPGCLCEPIQLRLASDDEDFDFALDPLTGGYNSNY